MSKRWLWIIVIVGGLAAVVICGACLFFGMFAAILGSDSTTAGNDQPVRPHRIGQDVVVGKVRWKVLEAQDLGDQLESDNQFIDPLTTSGRFILVRLEVENNATESRTFTEGDITDDQGRTFGNNSDAIPFIEDGELCVLEQINPNITKICTAIYEVPGDASGLKLVVGDLAPFGDEAEIDLRLK